MLRTIKRITYLFAFLFLLTSTAQAHHGWAWTTGGNIELTGVIQSVELGNPHGIVKIRSNKDIWTVEVGQPWRNERAGFKEGDLAKGVEVRVVGEPSAKVEERLLKAVRVYINGTEYDLYPSR